VAARPPEGWPDEKKAAVMAALLEGQSVRSVASKFNVPRSTVGQWRKDLAEPIIDEGQQRELGTLLHEYLTETVLTLIAQTKALRNTEYLLKQGASENAVLHGVMVDKAVRLLEALAPSTAD